MDKRDTERVIRMAISSMATASDRIATLANPDPDDEHLTAMHHLHNAEKVLRKWAKKHGHVVTETMVT